jgi:hypothetical protein
MLAMGCLMLSVTSYYGPWQVLHTLNSSQTSEQWITLDLGRIHFLKVNRSNGSLASASPGYDRLQYRLLHGHSKRLVIRDSGRIVLKPSGDWAESNSLSIATLPIALAATGFCALLHLHPNARAVWSPLLRPRITERRGFPISHV